MSLSDQHEERVRRALAALVDATPVGAEFDELTESHLTPARPRPPRSGVVVFGAAFFVVALVGGLMLWATRDTRPGGERNVAAGLNITWSDWFDQALSNSTQVHDSPLVLQGLPGPEPEFDVSQLGEEQPLLSLTDGPPVDWSLFESTTGQGPALVAGQIPGPVYIGAARLESQNPRASSETTLQVCDFTLDGTGLGSGCHGVGEWSDQKVDYGMVSALTDDPQGGPDSITIVTPPGASVVAINANGDRLWQRPRANMAVFLGDFPQLRIQVTIFDAEGNILHESSPTDPLEHSLMANAVEITEDEIFTEELKDLMSISEEDRILTIPIEDHSVLARIAPGRNPHLYATSCDVLVKANLPPGWQGTCLERTVDGQRVHGEFDYYRDLSN